MKQRTKERWGGLFCLAVGLGLTAFNWHLAIHDGHYYVKSSILGPATACIGLGLLVFPSYRLERLERDEDLRSLQGYQLITPRWWIIVALGLAAGLLNLYYLAHLGQ